MYLIDFILQGLSHFSEQSKVLAENVANVNTPNYKAFQLKPIKEAPLIEGRAFVNCTARGHIPSSSMSCNGLKGLSIEKMGGEEKPNGNDVDILQQMRAMSGAKSSYEMLSALFRGAVDLVHIAQSTSGK